MLRTHFTLHRTADSLLVQSFGTRPIVDRVLTIESLLDARVA